MKTEVLFNDGWEFTRQELDTTLEEIRDREEEFAPVGIPHDWLIYQVQRLYENGTGWYRKKFRWQRVQGELVSLCFDGVYMDCRVYVNDREAGEWKYGYSAFQVDMTPFLRDGETAMRRKLKILKEMGVNAVRLTHNMHASDVMDLGMRWVCL